MLRIVTTNNAEIFRHLGSGPFQRLELNHKVVTEYDEALSAIRELQPQIAMIDVDLAGGTGCSLCKQVKGDSKLREVHVIMVLSSVISRPELTELEESECDDVLAVPVHGDDFYHHIAQIVGLPMRRDRRIGIELELLLPGTKAPLPGKVQNVSVGGAGVKVARPLADGQELSARIVHDGTTYPEIHGRVAWTDPENDGVVHAGITFSEVPMKTRLLLERLCLFEISAAPEGGVTVSLFGDFSEMTDFSSLAGRLHSESKIDFNMRGVRYISSAGVRAWCDFLATIDGKDYSFRHCSMAFASQAAMVPMSLGRGQVYSLRAPYRCDDCDRDDVRLLETKAILIDEGGISPPLLKCGSCGGELEFDDVPDRYFAFLRGDGA